MFVSKVCLPREKTHNSVLTVKPLLQIADIIVFDFQCWLLRPHSRQYLAVYIKPKNRCCHCSVNNHVMFFHRLTNSNKSACESSHFSAKTGHPRIQKTSLQCLRKFSIRKGLPRFSEIKSCLLEITSKLSIICSVEFKHRCLNCLSTHICLNASLLECNWIAVNY